MSKHPPFVPSRPDGKARTALVSCRLIPEAADRITEYAKRKGISRAEWMRRAIGEYARGRGRP